MDCIQTENKAVDLFLPGGHGHGFKPGDPDAGVLATYVSPAWCNGVQEEILNVIRSVGMVPSGIDRTQLTQAINILVAAKVGGVGEVKLFYRKTAPLGWLKVNGTSIGNAGSGATQRANADTQALFTHLWTEFTDAEVPIQTSAGAASTRGASAAADFAAGKRMVLSDARSGWLRVADDGRGIDTGRTIGSWQDQQMLQHNHGVTDPGHTHAATVTDPGHSHTYLNAAAGSNPPNANANSPTSAYVQTDPSTTGITVSNSTVGTGLSVNNSAGGAELRTRNTAWLLCVSY